MAKPKFEFIDINGNAAGLTDPGASNTTLGGGSEYSVTAHNSKHYRNNGGVLQLIHNQTDFKNVIAPYAANNGNTAWTYTSLDSNIGTLTSTDANPVTLYGLIQAIKADITYLNNNKGYHKTGSWNGLTYTATDVGTGQALAFTIPTGTNATTVAAGNHGHGNITNDGKITTSLTSSAEFGNIVVTNANGVVKIADTNIIETALNLGSAARADVATGVDATTGLPTISQVRSLISTATAGLTGAMHFIGSVASGTVTDGGTESPVIGGYSGTVKTAGNVILFGGQEFIWTGSAWELFGDEGSYALKTTTVTGSGALDGGGALSQNQVITHKAGNAPSVTSGLYKFSTDGCSHIRNVTAVEKADITALGIPGADTHYTAVPVVTGSADGTTSATSAVTNPYMNIVENNTKSGGVQFKAGTGISVSGNGSSITITNSSPNSHNSHGVTVVSGIKADGSTNISASSTQSQSGLHSVTLGDSGIAVASTTNNATGAIAGLATYSAVTFNAKGIAVGGYVNVAYGASLNDVPTNLVDGGTFYVVD